MTERVWHKGPPPHVGWWNASIIKNERSWRWWDGRRWSHPAFEKASPEKAARPASRESVNQGAIRWSDYWPENARVPRLDPTAGDWTFHHGGRAPVIGLGKGRVQIAMRSGSTYTMPASQARQHRWVHQGNFGDIVGWRRIGKSMAQKGHHEHR